MSEEIIDLVHACHSNVKMIQNLQEISKLASIVSTRDYHVILEIGTEYGGTLNLWSHIIGNEGVVIGVDLDDKVIWDKITGSNIAFVQGNSQSVRTRNTIKKILDKHGDIDFLFIDGDHTYEGVKKDFHNYEPFVKDDGMIAFHDIYMCPDGSKDVTKFWNEIKGKYKISQEIHSVNNGIGIGIIIKE